jgi:glutamyl-tRNA synthetase
VWTALLAWLDARQRGGAFVLRMEDLDPDRSRQHFADQLLDDLHWLGLDWDEGPDVGGPYAPYVQDQRRDRYAAALEQLQKRDLVYACFCTRAQLRAAASAASAPHGAPPREQCASRCWALRADEQAARIAAGRRPALRLRLPPDVSPICFDDLCAGRVCDDLPRTAGDFVLRRADGVHAYQLAVVVDDGDMAITHVVRGADLLPSTARQIWLHRLLGYTPPTYAHVPLLIDRDGHRLSKRHASLAVAELRAAGKRPGQIVGWLARWAGLTDREIEITPRDLLGALDLAMLPRVSVVIDPQSLR